MPENLPDGEELLNLELQTIDKYGKHTIKLKNIDGLAEMIEKESDAPIVFGQDNAIVHVSDFDNIPVEVLEKYEKIYNELDEILGDIYDVVGYFGTVYTIDGKRYDMDNVENLNDLIIVKIDENADLTKSSHISMYLDNSYSPGEEAKVLLGLKSQDESYVEWIGIEGVLGNADNNSSIEFDVSPKILEKFENGYAYMVVF